MQYFYCIVFVLNALLHNTVYCSSWNPQKVNSYQNFYQSIVQTNSKPQSSNDYNDESVSNTNEYELIDSQQCSPTLHKIVFTQDYFRQYILYKHDIPALKEFTLCMWMKFYNHSTDHPLFSYSVDGQPKAIYSWVSNTAQSSFLSLAIDGQTFYRLNYPFKIYKWYHSCQSWNGQTGEWQMWINGERVGRGFHNRLVGHRIRPGGIAITGQERASNNGSSSTSSRGFQGELTMLQMYKVALTAGKAYADHKHHHVHLFDHHGRPITTTLPPTTTTTSPFASVRSQSHPLLTGNQLNPMLQLNFGLMPMQPMGYVDLNSLRIVSLDNLNSLVYGKHRLTKRDQINDINKPKRDLFYDTKNGNLVNLVDLATREQFEQYTGLSSSNNDADTTSTAALLLDQKRDNVQQQTTEIAAAEVSAIMNICSGCDLEPFKTSLVLSWRTDSKKLFSNSVLALANPVCKRF